MTGNAWYPQHAGGLEKYQYGLARELTRAGDAVDYFCTGTPTAWDERSRVFAFADPAHGTARRLIEITESYRRNYREPYDVLDIHFAFYGLPILPFVTKATPRVVHFQGPWGLESRAEGASAIDAAVKTAIERIVFTAADRFVTLSDAFASLLHDTFGISRAAIDVIPMGIDCDFFKPASDKRLARQRLGWNAAGKVAFTARRMVNRVGIAELIAAAQKLRQDGVRISFKIAGKGPLLEEYRDAVRRDGLADDVEFLGFISEDDLVLAYQAADVTILPTQSLEGFGTIISESLACGTPAIGTPVGGIVETLAAIDPSLLARSATPDAIANLLADFVGGRLRVPSAERCRTLAEERFAWPAIAARNRETYRRAATERRER